MKPPTISVGAALLWALAFDIAIGLLLWMIGAWVW